MAILTALDRLPNVRLRDEVADSNLFDVGRTRAPGQLVVTWGRRGAFTDRVLRSSKAVALTGEGSGRGARRETGSEPRGPAPAWPTTLAPARMASTSDRATPGVSRPGLRTWPSRCPRGRRGPPRGLPGHDDGALEHDHALAVPVGAAPRWTSSAPACPTTTPTAPGPTSSSRPPDGAIYEVDLLVLTKQGFWLVEIKSRPGRVEGDAGTWTWTDREGKRASVDNPVLLANRKAKALSSLLKAKMAAAEGAAALARRPGVPVRPRRSSATSRARRGTASA